MRVDIDNSEDEYQRMPPNYWRTLAIVAARSFDGAFHPIPTDELIFKALQVAQGPNCRASRNDQMIFCMVMMAHGWKRVLLGKDEVGWISPGEHQSKRLCPKCEDHLLD